LTLVGDDLHVRLFHLRTASLRYKFTMYMIYDDAILYEYYHKMKLWYTIIILVSGYHRTAHCSVETFVRPEENISRNIYNECSMYYVQIFNGLYGVISGSRLQLGLYNRKAKYSARFNVIAATIPAGWSSLGGWLCSQSTGCILVFFFKFYSIRPPGLVIQSST